MSFIKAAPILALVCFISTIGVARAGVMSIGPQGIDAVCLPRPGGGILTGLGAKIGQVEERRPTDIDVDTEFIENPTINPATVWVIEQDAVSTDNEYSNHATAVAGVMISTDGTAKGVATEASLYSSAYAPDDLNPPDSNVLRAMQKVATASGGVRAMNLSFGEEPGDSVDGLSEITMGVDWLATRYQFLPVSAGNETVDTSRSPPSDNFNGVTVAASKKRDNVYRQVADFNRFDADAEGDRVSVDLLAPGEDIELTGLFGDPIPHENNATDGTSFAAPHVVGTVALLQDHAEKQIFDATARWSENSRQPEVMKAVLLNSADKVAGVHGSSRTIIAQGDETAYDWRTTQAFFDSTISLDQQLGAGHLNARRALQQFESGEYETSENAPLRGWDFGQTGGIGTKLNYPLNGTLEAGAWVAVTLAWDRRVYIGGLIDYDKTYDQFDFFTGFDLEDLNLYLLPADATDLSGATQMNSSVSLDDNLEHIFLQVPATDDYKIVVHHAAGPGNEQFFGLAWWAGNPIEGDFDDDGDVDGADLNKWKNDFGQMAGSDANGDGDSDGADFLVWQQNLGTTSATPAAAAVPEPAAAMLGTLAASLLWMSRRRR